MFGGSKIANDTSEKETETTTTSNGGEEVKKKKEKKAKTIREFKVAKEMKEIEQQTGEEDEDLLFKTDGALYEYVSSEEDGKMPGWRERGRGGFNPTRRRKRYSENDNVRKVTFA